MAYHLILTFASEVFSLENPLDEEKLIGCPTSSMVETLLYLVQIESPIRYILNDITVFQDTQNISTLGPLAFAITSILEESNTDRSDVRLKNFNGASSFKKYIGCQYQQKYLDYLKELNGHLINLRGYQEADSE